MHQEGRERGIGLAWLQILHVVCLLLLEVEAGEGSGLWDSESCAKLHPGYQPMTRCAVELVVLSHHPHHHLRCHGLGCCCQRLAQCLHLTGRQSAQTSSLQQLNARCATTNAKHGVHGNVAILTAVGARLVSSSL